MAVQILEPPLTEPIVISCVYVTGTAIDLSEHVVRIVGWVHVPNIGGEAEERRITVRFAMPIDAARALREGMNKALRRVGH